MGANYILSASPDQRKFKGTYVDHWNQNSEKADNVDDQDEGFNLRQNSAGDRVDEHSDYNRSPKEQGTMPLLRDIVRMIQLDQCFNHGTSKITAPSKNSLPSAYYQPA